MFHTKKTWHPGCWIVNFRRFLFICDTDHSNEFFLFLLQEAIKDKALERARQKEWEKAHAVDSKKEPYNPFEGMKRQATILAQQAEKSPRQGPSLSKSTSGKTFSPAASLQSSAFKAVLKEREEKEHEESPPQSPPPT